MSPDVDPASEPEGGWEYHQLQRAGSSGWWRPLLGSVLLVVSALLLVQAVLLAAFVAGFLVAGQDVRDSVDRLVDTDHVTPLGLAYLNLSLAALIPICWLIVQALHRLPAGSLSSVVGRLRWRWFATCLALALVALIATLVVATLVPEQAEGVEMSGSLNDFTRTTRDFLLVIVLLTPLQAAGEEYAFRGYLTQAFGGLFRSRWVAVAVPAFLFALAHGAQDAPIFVDRFAFGLVAGILAISTGGLEAGIAMHVLNNFLAYGLALAFSDMSTALNPTGGTWWSLPTTLTQSLVYLLLATAVARKQGIATSTNGGILAAPRRRV